MEPLNKCCCQDEKLCQGRCPQTSPFISALSSWLWMDFFFPQRQKLIPHTHNNGNTSQDMNWRHFGLQTITCVEEVNACEWGNRTFLSTEGNHSLQHKAELMLCLGWERTQHKGGPIKLHFCNALLTARLGKGRVSSACDWSCLLKVRAAGNRQGWVLSEAELWTLLSSAHSLPSLLSGITSATNAAWNTISAAHLTAKWHSGLNSNTPSTQALLKK